MQKDISPVNFVTLDYPPVSCDAVVVIDVLRAFTTAAVAFSVGVTEILIAKDVSEAVSLKQRDTDLLTVGEVNGLKPRAFDYGNSPVEVDNKLLSGRRVVQTTTAGTTGLVLYANVDALFAASFLCAKATAAALRESGARSVAFVISGHKENDQADEDRACAEYIAALFLQKSVNVKELVARVASSAAAQKFLDPLEVDFREQDVEYAMKVDSEQFAMRASFETELLVLRPTYPKSL